VFLNRDWPQQNLRNTLGMKPVWTWPRLIAHLAVSVDHVKTVRPTCVGPLGGVIEGVDNRWEPDSKVRDAELAHLDALVEVLWTRKYDFVFQVVRVLPDITRMGFVDVHHAAHGTCFMVRAKASGDCNMAANKVPLVTTYTATSPPSSFITSRAINPFTLAKNPAARPSKSAPLKRETSMPTVPTAAVQPLKSD